MKKTGIIRRLDELGRIVIPKEIRKTLHIQEGTPLEINIIDNDSLSLKKFSPIMELGYKAKICSDALYDEINCQIFITDLEKLVSSSSYKNKEYTLSNDISNIIKKRKTVNLKDFDKSIFLDENCIHKNIIVAPIIVEGDILGSIIIDYQNFNENLISNAKITANIISKLTY